MDWQEMANVPIYEFFSFFDSSDETWSAIRGFDGSNGAIGYSMYYYSGVMKMADGYKILSIDGIYPDNETIKDGSYPFINPYYAVINADEPEDGTPRILLNWLLSEAGQLLIENENYVSIKNSPEYGELTQNDLRWNVKTDDSKLLPFVPLHLLHSKLSEGFLTEFIPSGSYGKIFPYSGAVTMNDGSLRIINYGLVTEDGVVVTDLVYDSINRAVYSTVGSSFPRPAYHIRKAFSEQNFDYGFISYNAAVALDGSWITSFEYVDIVFSDNVIFLMKGHEEFDIDVIDYNGQLLYNILDLEWADEISEDTWAGLLTYGAGEGYGFIKLVDETYGLMNVLTGEMRRTEFIEAFSFYEGLSAVMPDDGNNLWGFINKDMEMVITPAYVYETAFVNGRAVVETPDGGQHIINTQGDVLFSVTSDRFIIPKHDNNGFSVHLRTGWEFPVYYTGDFTEVLYPHEVVSLGAESAIQYIKNGWYSCMTEDGSWLFNHSSVYRIPLDRYVTDIINEYIIYIEYFDDFTFSYGVMMFDGTDIIYPVKVASLTAAVDRTGVVKFIKNSVEMQSFFVSETYSTAVYNLMAADGTTITTGLGILIYDEAPEIYYVQGTDYFALLDLQGNTFVSIPSMAYTFD